MGELKMPHDGVAFDRLIREALCSEAETQEPSPAAREELLAEAARSQASRLPVQESIPPLAQGLQDEEPYTEETAHWWEAERSLFENFTMWDNPWRNPNLVHVLLYQEAGCCRIKGAAC